MREDGKIDYIEWPGGVLPATKAFYSGAFGWSFADYGPDYVAFHGAGLEGGIYRADMVSRSTDGGDLTVFYSRELEASEALVLSNGASNIKPVFDFPGGRRFQFAEPRAMSSPSGRTSDTPVVWRSSE